jgi:hypothetical protein
MEIAMFVCATPKATRLTTTRSAAIRNAQWLPVHFATSFENAVKKRSRPPPSATFDLVISALRESRPTYP